MPKLIDLKMIRSGSMVFRILAVSVGACLVWIGGLVYLSNERDVLAEMYLDRQTTALNMVWLAVVKSYQIGMRAYFDGYIMQPRVLARWGGEEFVLLLTDTIFINAVPLVETIRQSIESLDFGEIGLITVSFGVTANRGNDTDDTLLNRADTLLYAAKTAGRNCVEAVE